MKKTVSITRDWENITTSNSMKENHKSVAILAPTLPSSNISINETKFNVCPVPGDKYLKLQEIHV
jgi:hypothetical protein